MTNYEKLMAEMTPEKLANMEKFGGCVCCPVVENKKVCRGIDEKRSCEETILDWLKQEAE